MQEVAKSNVENFHKGRKLFAIINDAVEFAETGTTEGHPEWFVRKGWLAAETDPDFETIVRGYSDGYDIYAYRGKDFLGDNMVSDAMRRHAHEVKRQLELPDTCRIFVGVIPDKPGKKWLPSKELRL